MFEIVDSQVTGPVIKVIGVGGAGGNAVNHMIEQGVQGVEFIAVNTDAQVLARNKAQNQIQLGTSGLGAGAKPEEARAVALADRDRIEEAVAGAHMVFITAEPPVSTSPLDNSSSNPDSRSTCCTSE